MVEIEDCPQERPKYHGYERYYKRGFANITKCKGCKNIALREDAHPASACKHCGGKVVDFGNGKWVPPL